MGLLNRFANFSSSVARSAYDGAGGKKKKKKKKTTKKTTPTRSPAVTAALKKLASGSGSIADKARSALGKDYSPTTTPSTKTTPSTSTTTTKTSSSPLSAGTIAALQRLAAGGGPSAAAAQRALSASSIAPVAQTTPNTQAPNNGSIVDYLNSQGKASDFNSRSALAAQYGITGYTGTAAQNTQLLGKLSSGGAQTTQGPITQTPVTTGGKVGTDVLPNGMTFDQLAVLAGYKNFEAMPPNERNALVSIQQYLTNKPTTTPVEDVPVDDPNVEVDTSPIFMGDETLVKYNGAYYLVDAQEKTMRPFESNAALSEAYGDDLEQALLIAEQQVITDADMGAFDDFTILGRDYAVKGDGTRLPYDNSPQSIKARYNSNIDLDGEFRAFMSLDRFVDLLSQESSGIDADHVGKLKNDRQKIAYYLNALTYGGYTLSDVYKDIKREELIAQGGHSELSNLKPISATDKRTAYMSSSAGANASSNELLMPPSDLVGLSNEVMNLPIYSMPSEAYKELVPTLEWNSPEMRAQLDEIQSLEHDILLQQLSATTEQEKAVADYNWDQFKNEVNRQFGIELSNNAYEAWNQLEGVRNDFSKRGIMNSGIQAETLDKYLRQVRTIDSRERESVKTKEESQEQVFYRNYASSDDIKRLVDEDKASGKPKEQWRATKWGLVPSDSVASEMSYEKLREKFPDLPEEDIHKKINVMIDENGNYRSKIYKDYMTNQDKVEDDKEQFQMDTLVLKKEAEEEEAYAQYTSPEIAFLRDDGDPVTPESDPIQLQMPSQFKSVRQRIKGLQGQMGETGSAGETMKEAGSSIGSTKTQFYRDPAGNIVDSTGKVITSRANLEKAGAEIMNKAGAFPMYEAPKSGGANVGSKKSTGTSTTGTKYTTKTPGYESIKLDQTQLDTLKKKNPTLAKTMGFI